MGNACDELASLPGGGRGAEITYGKFLVRSTFQTSDQPRTFK